MGKVEDMKALRLAMRAADTAPPDAIRPPSRTPSRTPSRQASPPVRVQREEAVTTDALCGHRSIANRTCTRPSAHAEKNHRYG